MKVAFVLDDSLDRPDGVQQYVLTIGGYLARKGHEVHFLCSGTTRTDLQNVHSLARNAGVSFNGNTLRIPLPTSRRRLGEFLRRERFDVIHVQTPHSPLFAGRVVREARRLNATIVGTFLIMPSGALSRLGTRMLGRALRRNLRLFDRFCAISPPAVEFARTAFGIECEMIPAAVDVTGIAAAGALGRNRGDRDRVIVAFLGRMVERKGALELVEALARMPFGLRPRMEVRLAGRGPLTDEVRRRIEEHHLGDVVTMPGFVSEEDKPRFLAEADVAVFPATGGESFGIVLAEAMAAGAGAVIGGDNPGYRSVLGDDPDTLVDPGDVEAFAGLLTRLVTTPDLRERIHAEQGERVRRFDIEVVGAEIEAFYRG
ncbi:MAG: glycosyltransferase family 4 protein [Demequinaceae bacterium]|nr:glycosyltransferase family 4 protein [Demequinaceae bacterium]